MDGRAVRSLLSLDLASLMNLLAHLAMSGFDDRADTSGGSSRGVRTSGASFSFIPARQLSRRLLVTLSTIARVSRPAPSPRTGDRFKAATPIRQRGQLRTTD